MFIAHLPAGYLLTRRLERRWGVGGLLWPGLMASVLPDIDLLRFYLLDGRQTLHHAYWTHMPFCWALLALAWFGVARLRGWRWGQVAGVIVFANVLLHLMLDTVAGGICWLAPFSDRSFSLFTVPAGHAWWISNFLVHWTFLLEVGIVLWAGWELPNDRALAEPGAEEERASRSEGRHAGPGSGIPRPNQA